MADTPCRVRRVVVRGNRRTHDSVIRQELSALRDARTLGEIGDVCVGASGVIRGLGVFDSAEMVCDAAPGQSADGLPLADVVVTVAEKKKGLLSAQTGVHTQSGEGSMDANVTVRNLLGRAERIDFKSEMGQQKSTAFVLSASKPRWLGTDTELTAKLAKESVSHLKHSSFIEKLRSVSVSVVTGQREAVQHELTAELALRDVGKLPLRTASWAMLQQRGMSAKASVRHAATLDRLDDSLVPTSGYALKLSNEVAGLLGVGDARFSKHALSAAAHVPLLPNGLLSLGLSLSAGLLMPTGPGGSYHAAGVPPQSPSCVCDRFFAGGACGAQPFRGFRTNGVGPREPRHTASGAGGSAAGGGASARDALGGEALGVATVSLSAPLPGAKPRAHGVRAQVFSSFGGLHAIRDLRGDGGGGGGGATVADVAGGLFRGARASVGAGLVMPTGLGRLELSISHVLKRQPQDAVQRSGWQIGISGTIV